MKTRSGHFIGLILCCSILSIGIHAIAQPYVDPFQVRYTYGFKGNPAESTPFTHLWAGSDLPVKLKNKTYLLFSPYYEYWKVDSAGTKEIFPAVQSIALPIGLVMPFNESKWSVTVYPVFRTNGEKLFAENTFQYGLITFAAYARKPQQKFRLGVYINKEFFGWFFWPLLGADWRIDDKNYLFGILPGRLTFEHKFGKSVYGGSTFRALTNSFRFSNGNFVRLDDNQLSLFMDVYPSKHICLTLEPGYGLYRRIRFGDKNEAYTTERNWENGFFIKLSAAYRIRL